MRRRTPLKNQLINAWTECIEYDYSNCAINGERALQACLYHHLSNDFETQGMTGRRRIFIEPTICGKIRTWRRVPDMVICDTNNVIAIVELKFHPRMTLNGRHDKALRYGTEKDLHTLLNIARDLSRDSTQQGIDSLRIEISNERYFGVNGTSKTYGLAANLMLVWAGIYKQSAEIDPPLTDRLAQVFSDAGVTVQGGFLQLHAQTQKNEHPVLIDRYTGWKTGHHFEQ